MFVLNNIVINTLSEPSKQAADLNIHLFIKNSDISFFIHWSIIIFNVMKERMISQLIQQSIHDNGYEMPVNLSQQAQFAFVLCV